MRFFVLKPDGGRFGKRWAYAEIEGPANRGECQRCPACGGAVSGLKWLPPHRIKLSSGKPEKWGDFLWGAGFPLLVSARFRQVYGAEGLSGIRSFDAAAEIVSAGRANGGLISRGPVYQLVDVPWGGANQDDTASELVFERPEKITCTYCRMQTAGRRQSSIAIDESSWNGSHIFKARGAPAAFIVTDRFKAAVEQHGLRNVLLIPAEDYAYDERRIPQWYVKRENG